MPAVFPLQLARHVSLTVWDSQQVITRHELHEGLYVIVSGRIEAFNRNFSGSDSESSESDSDDFSGSEHEGLDVNDESTGTDITAEDTGSGSESSGSSSTSSEHSRRYTHSSGGRQQVYSNEGDDEEESDASFDGVYGSRESAKQKTDLAIADAVVSVMAVAARGEGGKSADDHEAETKVGRVLRGGARESKPGGGKKKKKKNGFQSAGQKVVQSVRKMRKKQRLGIWECHV